MAQKMCQLKLIAGEGILSVCDVFQKLLSEKDPKESISLVTCHLNFLSVIFDSMTFSRTTPSPWLIHRKEKAFIKIWSKKINSNIKCTIASYVSTPGRRWVIFTRRCSACTQKLLPVLSQRQNREIQINGPPQYVLLFHLWSINVIL